MATSRKGRGLRHSTTPKARGTRRCPTCSGKGKILDRRIDPGEEQQQIAKDVGISESHVSLVLRGRRGITFAVARRLAERLGLTLDELAAIVIP